MTAPLEPLFRKPYILGGNARVTLVSLASGTRYTYRVRAKESLYFVSLLTGPDNDRDYQFLGTIFSDGAFRHGKKSPLPPSMPAARAWAWTWAHLDSQDVQVWHEGACSRCGRALTTPESIQRGLGPVCAGEA